MCVYVHIYTKFGRRNTSICQKDVFQASFTSVKLRSDTFKGVVTNMTILPLNKTLLLGADNGTIQLFA